MSVETGNYRAGCLHAGLHEPATRLHKLQSYFQPISKLLDYRNSGLVTGALKLVDTEFCIVSGVLSSLLDNGLD